MDIVGDDGTLFQLPLSSLKLIGRGSGIFTEDRTIAKNQVSLKAAEVFTEDDDAPPPDNWWEKAPLIGGSGKGGKKHRVRVEALGPNPICVLHQGESKNGGNGQGEKTAVRFLEQGEGCWLDPGDQISLSIVKPCFYMVRGPEKRELSGRPQEAAEEAKGRGKGKQGGKAKEKERGAGAASGLEKGQSEEEPQEEKAHSSKVSHKRGKAGGKRVREDEDETGEQGDGKRRRERKGEGIEGAADKQAAPRQPAETDGGQDRKWETGSGYEEADEGRGADEGTPPDSGRGRGVRSGGAEAGLSATFDPIKGK